MEEYKGSLQESLGISEERTDQLEKIAEGLAMRMDTGEFKVPSILLLEIQKLEVTEIEKIALAYSFGKIV